MNQIQTYKHLSLALVTAVVMTACGGGGKADSNSTSTTEEETLVADTQTVGSCSITEGIPKTDTRITVKVRCEGSTNADITSATVTLDGTTKNVEYKTSNFTDYIGFANLSPETSYKAELVVVASGKTLTSSVNIKTKKATTAAPIVATITHNGTTYGTVTSPYTGKVWLDRNLGAAQVCTSFNDTACYGDYYQWGRNFDGHQDSMSSTTTTQATDVNSAGSSFITSGSSNAYDWAKTADSGGSLRSANWSKTDGTSVCPVGFRVPTITELRAETLDNGVTDRDTAFANFLKLPSAGYRNNFDGAMNVVGSWGGVWSSSASGTYASRLYFVAGGAVWNLGYRAYGLSVRCLRN